MRTYDFTPLYRSAVGFDRLASMLESAARTSEASGWPPYNIETTGENAYRIEIAVAWHCGLWTARTENTLQIEREL